MRNHCLLLVLGLLLLFWWSPVSADFNLGDYFPNLILGPDPGQPDTVYVACASQTATQQIIQIRLKTNNPAPYDSIQGALIPLVITADRPGVTLDTTLATLYTGTALAAWDLPVVSVFSFGGNPSAFPLKVNLGGVDFGQHMLSNGDHLMAKLVFSISEPTNICVDTTTTQGGYSLSIGVIYVSPDQEYYPRWRGGCCGPVIPTLSEWGLIIFSLLLLTSLVFYLARPRRRITI